MSKKGFQGSTPRSMPGHPSVLSLDFEPIESSLAQIGCIKDDVGNFVAAVMACKTVVEETLEETIILKAFYTDGTVVSPFTGEWEDCSPKAPLIQLGNFCY